MIADLEKEMGRVKWERVRLGDGEIYTPAYADGLVLIAEKEDKMRSMIDRLERYLERKKLEMNAEKSKVMRFRKERGRLSERDSM